MIERELELKSKPVTVKIKGFSVEVPGGERMDSLSLLIKGQQAIIAEIERKIMWYQTQTFAGNFAGDKNLISSLYILNQKDYRL